MFGSTNPFGQSSSTPFASQSVFGQTNTASSNPFAPNPFGSTTPFGSQTGGSIFGGTSTGVFGAQSSSPLGSTAFGASSSPAFGSSTPSFGAPSTPAFGSSPSPFGGSSLFGQKPAFGGFGSTPTQSTPFGSTFQPSQPAFGSSTFGSSTPFGASNQPAFGAASTPAFGSTNTSPFGATNSPAFGATTTPGFGSTGTPGFGTTSTPGFGASSTPGFGATSTPAFGSTATPAFGSTGSGFGVTTSSVFGSGGGFGAPITPGFGATSSAFGAPSTPAFGATSTPAFGAASTPSFSFGSTPAFGQSSSAFGSSTFGTNASPFGAQSSAFGSQATTPTFGQSAFGGQRGGTRVAPYSATTEVDGASGSQPAKLESISAMPVYKDKSHEELRWEDYQLGDKGGANPAGQSTTAIGFGTSTTQANPFSSTSTFGQTSSNLFSTPTSSNPFASSTPAFGTTSTPAFNASPFGAPSTSNPFGTTSSASPSLFATSTPAFGSNPSPSIFGTSSSPGFGPSPSIFGSTSAQGTAPAFSTGLNFGNTQSSPLFQSTAPSFGQTTSAFGQATSAFGQSSTSPFGQSNIFSTPSTGFGGNLFSSTLPSNNAGSFGQANPSTQFPSAQGTQTNSGFGFGNFGQGQAAAPSSFGGQSTPFGQGAFGQLSTTQNTTAIQPAPVTNPYGTLPAMPQISIGRAGTSPSVQYGISSMPVIEQAAPVRLSSLLTSRHFSHRRMRLPVRKYNPNDGPKVPFFTNDEETPSTPKADALFIPRENPRALVIHSTKQWPLKANVEKTTPTEELRKSVYPNGKISEVSLNGSNGDYKGKNPIEDDTVKETSHSSKSDQKSNGVNNDHSIDKEDRYITLTGHRAGEAAIVYEHGADIETLMPKLRRSDYYTEPRIQELAAKERAEPGFTSHVKDFVIGRHGYGSIKFLGETDVRRLDLESIVQFNNREVIVYMDDSKKPPVGKGLNKPAEVTLLNIKCFDKKTGRQYTEGARIEKYKEMLKRKAEDQGAEFVSYDPVEGEWKFRVSHFSKYVFGEDELELELCA